MQFVKTLFYTFTPFYTSLCAQSFYDPTNKDHDLSQKHPATFYYTSFSRKSLSDAALKAENIMTYLPTTSGAPNNKIPSTPITKKGKANLNIYGLTQEVPLYSYLKTGFTASFFHISSLNPLRLIPLKPQHDGSFTLSLGLLAKPYYPFYISKIPLSLYGQFEGGLDILMLGSFSYPREIKTSEDDESPASALDNNLRTGPYGSSAAGIEIFTPNGVFALFIEGGYRYTHFWAGDSKAPITLQASFIGGGVRFSL
jgi:hypothetical protein